MLTDLVFDKEAREKMKDGVDKLADAVKVTLGAKGRNVAIRDERTGKPKLTKDGVTVARSINLPDKTEDMGAQLVKAAAEKTAVMAGDGTTTSTLLAQVIIAEGMKCMDANSNPVDVKKGIDKAVAAVVAHLKSRSTPVGIKSELLVNVATISANNDAEIGEIVAGTLQEVGSDGVVTVLESKTEKTYSEIVEGLQIDKGYISPYFVNNPAKMAVEFADALIFMSERKITKLDEIQRVLEFANAQNPPRPLLIIAEDVEAEALAVLVANKVRKNFQYAAIRLPGFGNMSLQMLEDVATITGGQVMSEQRGDMVKNIDLSKYLGRADHITISSTLTNITGGKGSKKDIQAKIENLKGLIESNPSEYEKDKIRKQRLAKVSNGVGIIYVGANTEVEMKEKKDRIDDAVCATKAAMEEGISPGGGIAYLKSIPSVDKLTFENVDENLGVEIVIKALKSPIEQMLYNAGVSKDKSYDIIKNLSDDGEYHYGYNLHTGAFEDFRVTGILDPTKVSRCALENAASVGSMFLTTACAITDIQPPVK